MSKTEQQMFARIERKFNVHLKDTLSEVRAEQPEDQEWDRIVAMFNQYGGFLELYPEAMQTQQTEAPAEETPPAENEEN